jgi:hypothetical protein
MQTQAGAAFVATRREEPLYALHRLMQQPSSKKEFRHCPCRTLAPLSSRSSDFVPKLPSEISENRKGNRRHVLRFRRSHRRGHVRSWDEMDFRPSALVLLSKKRALTTARRRLSRIHIRVRWSRTGYNTDNTGLRDRLPLFSTSYDVAGNGCNGTGSAGRALRCGKLWLDKQGHRGKPESSRASHLVAPLESSQRRLDSIAVRESLAGRAYEEGSCDRTDSTAA